MWHHVIPYKRFNTLKLSTSGAVKGSYTYPGLITQSERVEGAHGEELAVRSPGHCGDRVIVRRAGEEEPPIAVPHLDVTEDNTGHH